MWLKNGYELYYELTNNVETNDCRRNQLCNKTGIGLSVAIGSGQANAVITQLNNYIKTGCYAILIFQCIPKIGRSS